MLHTTICTTEAELRELTGLDHNGLWDAGFDLDDWDIAFVCDEKMHTDISEDEAEEFRREYGYDPDPIQNVYDSPYYWLLSRMVDYCVGPSYVEYKGKHYYLVHHS